MWDNGTLSYGYWMGRQHDLSDPFVNPSLYDLAVKAAAQGVSGAAVIETNRKVYDAMRLRVVESSSTHWGA